jgi:hypothetical protein
VGEEIELRVLRGGATRELKLRVGDTVAADIARMTAIRTGIIDEQEKLKKIGEEADKLRAQLAQVQGESERPTGEILVSVSAAATSSGVTGSGGGRRTGLSCAASISTT